MLIDFILIYICYVAGLMLRANFESLIFGMFITRFPGLYGMYDEYCFLDFLLYWLCFLHFKYIQIYNITKISQSIILITLFLIELILLKLLFQLYLSWQCISEEIIYVLPILVLIFLLDPLTSFQIRYFLKLGSMRCPELYTHLN